MSALLEVLHADQRRLDAAGLGLATEHSGQSDRLARLMADNAEQREQIRALSLRVAELSEDLRTLRGDNATPERGCRIARVIVGDAYVPVEYEYQPAEAPVLDLNSPRCGPGCPEQFAPLRIFLNGKWNNLEDVRVALDDERLIEQIAEAQS